MASALGLGGSRGDSSKGSDSDYGGSKQMFGSKNLFKNVGISTPEKRIKSKNQRDNDRTPPTRDGNHGILCILCEEYLNK